MMREDFLRQEIERYRKKIDTYRAMISEWESELGIVGGALQAPISGDSTAKKKDSGVADPLSLVQEMIFFRKSQPEAAKALLEMVGYPLKTSVMLEAVEKGGVTVGGKTQAAKKQNFYTSLHRSPDFALAKKDMWGLVIWGLTKKASEEEESQDDSKKNDKQEAETGEADVAAASSKT
jgi:hypothetical protein